MISKKSVQAILVSHTHWDRAWYLPFEEFRFRLVHMIDRILLLLDGDKDFKCFVLDGQTILIDDYLEIRPENKSKLKSFINSGRLLIGPWYILPDLFLVSGESTIRNLQIGHEMMKEFGGKMDVGYVPDPFGHIAQLPQILQGFGISTFVFMRGMPDEILKKNTLLFNWLAPDSSSVLSYYTKDGYLNAANLGYDKEIGRYDFEKASPELAEKRIEHTIDSLKEYFPENIFLLNNGMDHMPEQPELPALIKHLNEVDPDTEYIQGTFSDFMNLVKSRGTDINYSGNLLGNPNHPILQSVYSTRTYLKQQNQQAQGILEKVTEPLSLVSAYLSNSTVPHSFLKQSWKTLLKNHPHDDICGCSADAVHEDNEARFRQVVEICGSICTDSIEKMQSIGFEHSKESEDTRIDARSLDLFVFNPHPFEQNSWIETEVVFPNLHGEEEEVLEENLLKAFDANGKELLLEVLETQAPYLKTEFIQFTWGRKYRIRVKVKTPALGYHIVTIKELKLPAAKKSQQQLAGKIENSYYSINWNEDSLTVLDKKTGTIFNDFIKFEYVQDNGDTYSFSRASHSFFSIFKKVERGEHQHSISAFYSIEVPENLTGSIKVNIPLKITIDLSFDDELRLSVSYKNIAENGRLRAFLPLGFKSEESFADGHFMMYKNTRIKELNPEDEKDTYDKYPGELDYPTHFMGDYCFSKGTNFNTWIATKGLHEYELIPDNSTTRVAITLHRSVGFLSVGNGSIRRPHAGPKIAVPGAQCLRDHKAELSWGTTTSNEFEINKKALGFSYPVYARELPVFKGELVKGKLPRMAGFLNIEDKKLRLSCFKQLENTSDIIIRIYNLSTENVTSKIYIGFDYSEFCTTDFYEQWNDKQKQFFSDKTMTIELAPHQIKTFRLRK